jgi:iron complex outermembrane receptor protein
MITFSASSGVSGESAFSTRQRTNTNTSTKGIDMIFRHPRPRRSARGAGLASSSTTRLCDSALPGFKIRALVFAVGCALAGAAVLAPSPVPAAEPAADTASREYALSAGRLSDVLAEFAAAAGVQLIFDPQTLAGLRSDGLQGRHSVREGFERLLAGSGYELVDMGGDRYSLRQIMTGSSSEGSAITLAPVAVTVTAINPNSTMTLMPEYAGGQVARGGSVGMLGNKDVMDTPFSQTNYTNKTIQDQQAQTVQDVLSNDPSILTKQNSASDEDGSINIRGFRTALSSGAGSLNGLAGMAPLRAPDMDYIERVEVLKGPSALLNGIATAAAQNGPGGTYNLVTKQAGDEPLTELTARYGSRSQLGAHLDVGRRFGAENQFGLRVNGAYRDGDTPVDPISAEVGSAAINLDYRGERVRISADIAHQSSDASPQIVQQLAVTTLGVVPKAPDAGTSLNSVWSEQPSKLTLGMVRGEVDVTDTVTAYAAIGKQKLDFSLIGPNQPTLRDASGTYGFTNAEHSNFAYDVLSMQGGLRATAVTGPVNHAFSLNLSQSRMEYRESQATSAYTDTTNIYDPVFGPAPFVADPGAPKKSNETRVPSIGVADTLSILDERIQFIAGIRHQKVESDNFNTTTGAETSSYEGKAWTPALGLIVKPWQKVSLYANYIENLQAGTIVGTTFANSGEVFEPYVSKQYEAGVKVDSGTVTTTLAAFQIAQPNTISIADPNGGLPTLALDGEVRNRGIELNAYGELMPSVRLMGGVTGIDARQMKTQDGLYDGNRDDGIPIIRTVVGGEWDTPFLQDLTLTGRVTYTGDQVVSSFNEDLKIPSWSVVDLGTRYVLDSPWNGKPVTLRFNVDNAFDKDYWSGTNNRYIQLGAPRTFRFSATFDL